MPRTESRGVAVPALEPAGVLAAYHDGVTAICELAAQFSGDDWSAFTPCLEWRAIDVAGHLRCVADDYHEYLDEAPASRLARLMATGAYPETVERKLARQHLAELAALPDVPAPVHIAAFAASARAYAARLTGVWNLPHHHYRDAVITVAGMAQTACAEWHLHAWDLARALGQDYRPAAPHLVLASWRTGLAQPQAGRSGQAPDISCRGAVRASVLRAGRRPWLPGSGRWRGALRADRWRTAPRGDPWLALLIGSGRSPQ